MITPDDDADHELHDRLAQESPFRVLCYLYSNHSWRLLGATGCYILKHSPVWLIPLMMANAIDAAIHPTASSASDVLRNALLILALLGVAVPLQFLYVKWVAQSQREIEVRLRTALSRRLHILSLNYFDDHSAGLIQNKLVRDVETTGQLTRILYDSILSSAINIVFALIFTGIRRPIFLLYFLLLGPFTAVCMKVILRPLAKHSAELQARFESLSTKISNFTTVLPLARAHGSEDSTAPFLHREFEAVSAAGLRTDKANALFGSLAWVAFQAFYVLSFTAAVLASVKHLIPITPGEIVLFSTYFLLITNAIIALGEMIPRMIHGLEGVRSIGEVFRHSDIEHNEGKPAITRVEGGIRLENVSLTYKTSSDSALSNVSLSIRPGETIALIGRSGAGKSTMIKLILGFLQPTSGRVFIDGSDLASIDLRSYRKFLSIVPQELAFFEGTVLENVSFGSPSASETDIKKALDESNALDFVLSLPQGINTRIGEKGARLSGGQRQRLAIAAALVRDPRILILDEATSSLDLESEGLVQSALARLMKGRTSIIIAHRPSTIRLADRIISLDKGQIVEDGSHDTLLRTGGFYSRFYPNLLTDGTLFPKGTD